jgi:hypothetical protein
MKATRCLEWNVPGVKLAILRTLPAISAIIGLGACTIKLLSILFGTLNIEELSIFLGPPREHC